jgi:hypothetical protein
MVSQASQSLSTGNGNARVHSPYGVLDYSKIAAIAADFPRRGADENCGLGRVCRIASRRLFGHCFGGLRAPGGDSLFCFGYHPGSLATIHANSATRALSRFANLAMRSHPQATLSDVEAEIGEAVEFIIHAERRPGRRVIREVLALKGYDRAAKRFLLEAIYEVDHESA